MYIPFDKMSVSNQVTAWKEILFIANSNLDLQSYTLSGYKTSNDVYVHLLHRNYTEEQDSSLSAKGVGLPFVLRNVLSI